MNHLFKYIRYYILIASCIIAAAIYLYVMDNFMPVESAYNVLSKSYSFIAVGFLFMALFCSPMYAAMPTLPYRALYVRARRALGVSAFLFASLHSLIAFYPLLGGFDGVPFLSQGYVVSLTVGLAGLLILFFMAGTSFDFITAAMGKYWKHLHRFVYIAALLIILHVLMIGSDFINLGGIISSIFFAFTGLLFVLESLRFSTYLHKKFEKIPKYIFTTLFVGLSMAFVVYIFLAGGLLSTHSGQGH